jgi:DNA helicase HerA-like ATPase
MSLLPLEEAEGRRIGTVEYVSPSEIKVGLDVDAPSNTALNAGMPRPFPRVNGYILIPSEEGFVVGQIECLGIERSAFPKRKGPQDYGLVDLPYPLRKLSLSPVGTLTPLESPRSETVHRDVPTHRFRRGVYSFPTVGDPAILPTNEQLRDIVESGEKRRFFIGHAPLAGNAEVRVDPDRLFGRHLAVLGNTGSGKSCTVAGLIQWSLEEASSIAGRRPNARFIILDPNGEYDQVFKDKGEFFLARIFKGESEDNQLEVPLWFWNSDEWSSFMQASGRAQRPLLRRALREIRSGTDPLVEATHEEAKKQFLRRYLSSQLIGIRKELRSNGIKDEESKFGFRLRATADDLNQRLGSVPNSDQDIKNVIVRMEAALAATFKTFVKGSETIEYFRAFTEGQVNDILDALQVAVKNLGGIVYEEGPDENTPIPFDGAAFADHLEILAEQEGISHFLDTLVIRVRTMLADTQMRKIVSGQDYDLKGWLEDYIGSSEATNGAITIVNLSLVPSEIIHIVTAVIARMIFEALQRYRLLHPEGKTLPTVLVMEEAHTFIKRYRTDSEDSSSAAACCRVFERIAREGRKFGLGLVLSSQRPSELSPTVLSQCNSFIHHRISNDRDQDAVGRLLPDHLRGVLRELPVLPSRHAFLLGWATELPILTQIRELSMDQQPRSQDPDFWSVWIGKDDEGKAVERGVDWKTLAERWQGGANTDAIQPTTENDTNVEADDPGEEIPF